MSNTKREKMKALGFEVYSKRSHAPGGCSWDYSAPFKGSMHAAHYRTEAEAWAEATRDFDRLVRLARKVVGVVDAA